jgi:cell division protein FtsB
LRPLWIPAALVVAALGWAVLDGERGVPALLRMRADLAESHARMDALRQEIASREGEAAALRTDPFAIEEAIRRDLGFARPGEILVRIPGASVPSLWIP